jgi:hypothetical protein
VEIGRQAAAQSAGDFWVIWDVTYHVRAASVKAFCRGLKILLDREKG